MANEGPIGNDRPPLLSSSNGKTDSEDVSPGVRDLFLGMSSKGERRPARKSGLCGFGDSLALRAASNMKSKGDGSLAFELESTECTSINVSGSESVCPSPSSWAVEVKLGLAVTVGRDLE